MIAFTPRPQQSDERLPLPVGVFEDDTLLLHLTSRSRQVEFGCSRAFGPTDSDDLAFEDARRAESATWDL